LIAGGLPAATTRRRHLYGLTGHTPSMDPENALSWLRQVEGQLYRNNRHPSGKQTWVAVVRTPRNGRRNGKLIIALGSSMEEAASAAEGQWQSLFPRGRASH